MRLVPRETDFSGWLRSPRVAARVGVWLGVCFGVAFITGLISHVAYEPPGWLTFPTRPVSLYRITQGTHVVAGTMAVPLLLVKLWVVYPKLFAKVPWGDVRRLVVHGLERASIAALVAAAIFQLVTGLANSSQWYPWGSFSFRDMHYAVAWVAIGSLALHVAVKLRIARAALASDVNSGDPVGGVPDVEAPADSSHGLTRRGLLRTTWVAAGLAGLSTAGISVPWLRDVSIFGIRSGDGPQGVPINQTAVEARVTAAASKASYRLEIVNGATRRQLSRADLEAMPQRTKVLPIACVEGWSASAEWGGVRLRDLLAVVGAPSESVVAFVSLEEDGAFNTSELPAQFSDDPLTLIALRLNGADLSIDHGYPCRLIAPARPGVFQTKWLSRIEVVA